MKRKKVFRGFTLPEILIVVTLIAILSAGVISTFKPSFFFSQANNAQRRSDINTILEAIYQYAADNRGALPAGVDSTDRYICKTSCPANYIDLCGLLVPSYVADLPHDPASGYSSPGPTCATYTTGYTISKNSYNQVTLKAPNAESGVTISVTK